MSADSHKKKNLTTRAPGAQCTAWALERDKKPRGHQGDYTAQEKRAGRAEGAGTRAKVEVELTDTVRRYGERMRQERVSFSFKALADICKGK